MVNMFIVRKGHGTDMRSCSLAELHLGLKWLL